MPARRIKHLSQFIQKRLRISEYTYLIILSIVVGLVVGAVAVVFRLAVHGISRELFQNPDIFGLNSRFGIPSWILLPLLPAGGGLIVGLLIYRVLKLEGGHGVPAVIKSVATGVISLRPSMAVKSASSVIIMGSGGSAGPEGPIVEIGSVLGAAIGRVLGMSRYNLGILVGCGAAAGLSAVFNAPIGAVFFTLELILPYMSIRVFSPVILSSVVAGVLAQSVFGRNPAFHVPPELIAAFRFEPFDVATFALLGAFCAVLSWLFIQTLDYLQKFFTETRAPVWARPAIGGLMVGVIGLAFPQVMGEGYDYVDQLFNGEFQVSGFALIGFLLLLPLVKIVATSSTLGSGGTGGIFAPAMVTGAMGGALFGHVAAALGAPVPPGIFALVGMAGVVAGMLNAPLAGMFIIFEVTGGNYQLIVPMMATVAMTTVVTRRLQRAESVYTLSLLRDGFDVETHRQPDPLVRLTVTDAMHRTFIKLRPEMTLDEILQLVADSDQPSFPVINNNEHLIGVISMNDLRSVLSIQDELSRGLIAADIIEGRPPTLLPGNTLQEASHLFASEGAEGIAIVKAHARRDVIGMIYRADVFATYRAHGKRPLI